jgi:ribosomal protein S12 methylthiotransferase
VRELLVISQDTSAYGVDVKYRTGFVGGRPLRTRLRELCEALAELGIWVRLHYVYPYPSVDALAAADGRRQDAALPRRAFPACQRPHPEGNEASSERREQSRALRAWRAVCPEITVRSTFITGFPGETEAEFEELLAFLAEARLDRVGCFAYSPVDGATPMPCPAPCRKKFARNAGNA